MIQTRGSTSIQSWKVWRGTLIGGAVAAEAAMLFIAGSMGIFMPVLYIVLEVSTVGAILSVVFAYVRSRRKHDSLGELERELAKATAILERGLINEAEYSRLKGQVLEHYHYTSGSRGQFNLWRAALWGSSLGLLVPMLVFIADGNGGIMIAYTIAAALAGAGVAGGGTAATRFIQVKAATPELADGSRLLTDTSSRRGLLKE